ncbi:MAG TPA: hypothetical protein VHQ47_14665, partial [Phycisphaerae bacterium]|nr:hypothetical protein [Phycisphaerae bacterium]
AGGGGGYVRTGDIRDAYFVARELAAGDGGAVRGWDQNGDGVVDDGDVKALAMAAVRLPVDASGPGGDVR